MKKLLLVLLAVFTLLAGCSGGGTSGTTSTTTSTTSGSTNGGSGTSTPSSFSVAGKVASKGLDGSTAGWPDVTVTLDGDLNLTTKTDADGNFTFKVPKGEYRVTPTQKGITFDPPSSAWPITDANLGGVDFSVQPLTAGAATLENTWQMTGSMVYQRHNHTMTILKDGRVLVTGGVKDTDSYPRATCEIYDPATRTWKLTGKMNYEHSDHTATLLEDGKVLVVGGGNLAFVQSIAELYDPVTETWTTTGSMGTRQSNHTATRLRNGKVLVAGYGTEIYDPKTGTWSSSNHNYRTSDFFHSADNGIMFARSQHTTTLVPHPEWRDDVIILIGGNVDRNGQTIELNYYAMVDIPQMVYSGDFYGIDTKCSRRNHTATLMPDGSILVVGGASGKLGTSTLSSVDSAKEYVGSSENSQWSWHIMPSMTYDRSHHTATLLPNGQVLVAGGFSGVDQRASAELYDTVANKWVTTDYMKYARERHTTALLQDGRVLVAGGKAGTASSRASCELFTPAP